MYEQIDRLLNCTILTMKCLPVFLLIEFNELQNVLMTLTVMKDLNFLQNFLTIVAHFLFNDLNKVHTIFIDHCL